MSRDTTKTRTNNVSRWLIVVSAFVVGFLTDGLNFSFGVLLVEFLEEFQHERASTALIGSLAVGVFHLVGPLAGLLSDILGARAVVIVGALICFAGFVGAMFSNSLATLSISYGFFGGLGFGLMFLPANAAVIQHFNKRRALATGIAMCGTGVGTFVNNLLIRYLIDKYTWRWAMLIIAGMVLHGIPCGLMLGSPGDRDKDSNNTKLPDGESRESREISVIDTQEHGNSSVNGPQEIKTCSDTTVNYLSNETKDYITNYDIEENTSDTITNVQSRCSHIISESTVATVQCNDDTNNEPRQQTHKRGSIMAKTKTVLHTNLRLLTDLNVYASCCLRSW